MALGTLTIEPNTETLESTLLKYFLYGLALVNNLNDETRLNDPLAQLGAVCIRRSSVVVLLVQLQDSTVKRFSQTTE